MLRDFEHDLAQQEKRENEDKRSDELTRVMMRTQKSKRLPPEPH